MGKESPKQHLWCPALFTITLNLIEYCMANIFYYNKITFL